MAQSIVTYKGFYQKIIFLHNLTQVRYNVGLRTHINSDFQL